jgi:hypothetical protein
MAARRVGPLLASMAELQIIRTPEPIERSIASLRRLVWALFGLMVAVVALADIAVIAVLS